MAIVPPNIQVTSIEKEVLIVVDGGQDNEKVFVRYHPTNSVVMGKTMKKVWEATEFTDEQKSLITFWMGYFYAHLG
jgi:hypothetical protein